MEEFWTRRYKLKSGIVIQRPESRCKSCLKEVQKAYYQKTKERRKVEMRKYHARTKGLKTHREKRRESQAVRRRKLGYKPLRWDGKQARNGGRRLPVEPLARFIDKRLREEQRSQIARITGVSERRIYEIDHRAAASISLATVDAILTGFGLPELLNELYPLPPEEGERVGYKIVST